MWFLKNDLLDAYQYKAVIIANNYLAFTVVALGKIHSPPVITNHPL